MALMLYGFIAAMSVLVFVWRSPLAEIFAVNAAPLGALLTLLSLVTGSLWGKPTWGTFWVWDARLTSVLVLLFTYAGYGFFYKAWGARPASLFALFGAFNLPIIKGSVNWWNTLHQPASVAKFSAPSLHSSMLIPLLLMAAAYFFFSTSLVILRVQTTLRNCKTKRVLRQE
jgi:heme exporter protein C